MTVCMRRTLCDGVYVTVCMRRLAILMQRYTIDTRRQRVHDRYATVQEPHATAAGSRSTCDGSLVLFTLGIWRVWPRSNLCRRLIDMPTP